MKKVLIINGSLGGEKGNTGKFIETLSSVLSAKNMQLEVIHLSHFFKSNESDLTTIKQLMETHDGFVFTTGTYWDSWGSPLQRFFETITPLENDPCMVGKPALACVTMHSVGGKSVLSRLLGVLNTYGILIPPYGSFCYSMVNQELLKHSPTHEFRDDLWSLDDLEIIAENFSRALDMKIRFEPWPVDRKDPKRIWFKLND